MKNTLLNTLNKAPLAAMLLALLAVTAAREIALFTSFAASDRDQLLAGLFALALVLAKPMMAAAAGQQWAADNKPLAVVCWLLVVPLLALSIASTVLYFESAYQVQAVAEQQSSSEYQNTAATISAKQTTAELMKQTAADLKDDGNTLNARRLLEKAALIDDELADLREQQNSLPAAATTAASISGNHLGGWRWGAWADSTREQGGGSTGCCWNMGWSRRRASAPTCCPSANGDGRNWRGPSCAIRTC